MADDLPVLIRVYNRINDLLVNLEIIREHWVRRNYSLFVVSNGIHSGYPLPENVYDSTRVIELPENTGHLSGAVDLLKHGLEAIPSDYEYVVTLEADTWVLSDRIVNRYLKELEKDRDRVWAGGNWVDKLHSVATDFAIIRLPFIKENTELLDFSADDSIEACIYSDILRLKKQPIVIKEVYPTHLPRAMPWVIQARDRRRQVFPKVPMVTHHLEKLTGGIAEKKRIANQTAGKELFPDSRLKLTLTAVRMGYLLYENLLTFVPKSRWIKGRKLRGRDEN